jgi:hypothetical protein
MEVSGVEGYTGSAAARKGRKGFEWGRVTVGAQYSEATWCFFREERTILLSCRVPLLQRTEDGAFFERYSLARMTVWIK